MRTADPSGGLEKCWQAKELLRNLLTLARTGGPDRSLIWQRLTDFYTHCADSGIAQLRRLAWTVNAWQPSIIEGLITGISNGRTEGYNRIVKHSEGSRSGSGTPRTRNAGYASPAPAHRAGRQPELSVPVKSEDP
jgi:hypothetical protein